MFEIDRTHDNIDIFASPMTQTIWKDKYKWKNEATPFHTMRRVADAIFPDDQGPNGLSDRAFTAMQAGLWLPGGRIFAGAGTAKRVTLMNCYVNATIEDSMEGIMKAHTNAALTLQQGGGIGTDFSTLRPEGALLQRTHTKASGPIPFMHMWDSMSRTIRSAGDRRGAMMGTIADWHPDVIKFIKAKQVPKALEQFNVSILVSDALIEAVREDADWVLYFPAEPVSRDPSLAEYDEDGNFAYQVLPARELWEMITRATYEYSEPGVIFIDRVNELNNLWYCEDIRCTNPCGEQPLPPHGTCNLGHVNLARVVTDPFTSKADVNMELITEVVKIGVRFLDNVIDVTSYPLDEQAIEERTKRRLGLGFTGLADMLAQMCLRYGSPEAVRLTKEVTRHIAYTAYQESIELAKEKGSFSLFDAEKYLGGHSFASELPEFIRDGIRKHGIRNSLLLTVAPTGTGSIFYGNVSSGGEPVFLHETQRKVLKKTESKFEDDWDIFIERGYGAKLWKSINPDKPYPSYMVTMEDLSIEDHVVMQAAAQSYIDSSMSKTINVPEDTSYEQFVKVYELAYALGCKGCTTYRPSEVRGSILSKPGENQTTTVAESLSPRPIELTGTTYKLQWPSLDSALYLTINDDQEGKPFEVFINSKDAKAHDWTTALSLMLTAHFRRGGAIDFIPQELTSVQSLNDTAFLGGQHHKSLPAYIGHTIQRHMAKRGTFRNIHSGYNLQDVIEKMPKVKGSQCPQCKQMTLIRAEGCTKCQCGYNSCS